MLLQRLLGIPLFHALLVHPLNWAPPPARAQLASQQPPQVMPMPRTKQVPARTYLLLHTSKQSRVPSALRRLPLLNNTRLEKTGEARGAAPRGARESEHVGQPPDDAPAAYVSQCTPSCPAALLSALRSAVLCAGPRHCAPMRWPPFSARWTRHEAESAQL